MHGMSDPKHFQEKKNGTDNELFLATQHASLHAAYVPK